MTKFVIRHPHLIILAVFLLTVLAGLGLRRGLILDVSPLGFTERDSQAEADFKASRKNFGPDDYLIAAVVCDDIFAPENLGRLRALHRKITETKGVREVLSLINAPYARSVDGVVEIGKLIPDNLIGPGHRQQLIEAESVAIRDRLYSGNLVSKDATTAALNILLNPDLPTEARHRITAEIYNSTRVAGFKKYYFAGDPFGQWRATAAIKSDLRIFLPLTLILIAILLWFCFRSLAAVALPLITIGIGLVWLMGLMAYLNAHFTILALMLPTLMLAIGCSYMIHVVNQVGVVECKMPATDADPKSSLLEAMTFINLPVIVSALTIIAGFLSLAFTRIPSIRSTAVFAAIGAAFTMILSLTFLPAALALLPPRARVIRVGLTGKLAGLLEDTGRWATTHQMLLYILTVIIVVVSLIGMWRIRIDIDYFHFFKPNSETSTSLDQINKRLSGAVTFDIIVDGQNAGMIEDPENLKRMAQLQSFAEQNLRSNGKGVDLTISVVDFVKHLNRAFHDNDPAYYVIPSDRETVRELLSERDQMKSFITADGKTARILVRSNLSASQSMAWGIREIEKRGRELFPGSRVFATGTLVLLNRTSDQIGDDQIKSITIALVTIFIMLSILFRSVRVGMTALVPNLIPVLFFFGFMGWQGIPLNLTTSLVASVVLGLAVDNAVQFLARFRRVQQEAPTLRIAIIESMRFSGRPIIYANIALAAAFTTFSISNFEPIASFGLLSAVTIIGCLIEDLVLLPSRLTSPVFKAK